MWVELVAINHPIFFELSAPHHIKSKERYGLGIQLQQGQIGIAVKRLILALLRNVVLKDGGRLWIISIQSIEDGFDMSRSGLALGKAHHFEEVKCTGTV